MQRPTSVTVFGILNIVFAVFGFLGVIANVFLMFVKPNAFGPNPAVKMIEDNANWAAWMKLSIPLGMLSCGLLLAAGIGLLMLKEWGRKLSLVYGIYAIVMALVNMAVSYVFLIRPLMEQAARQKGPEAAGAIGGAIGGGIGGCIALVYPVLLLIFMTRSNVKAAFLGSATLSEYPEEPGWPSR
jgi:hypothetical protein